MIASRADHLNRRREIRAGDSERRSSKADFNCWSSQLLLLLRLQVHERLMQLRLALLLFLLLGRLRMLLLHWQLRLVVVLMLPWLGLEGSAAIIICT